jgi:glucose/arabinose dehydrogenase
MNSRVLSLAFVVLVACNPGSGNDPGPSGVVSLVTVAAGFDNPVYVTNAGSGNDLYVVEKTGKVKILENAGSTPRAQTFLDIASQVDSGSPSDPTGERGLLSIAFHPKYATNGFVFAYYTAPGGNLTVSRFTANTVTKLVDVSSKKVLLSIPHLRENHNGGQLQFGSDGFLYVGTGDGGGGGDPDGNGQNKQTLLGKLLRIDVDAGTLYAIPDGNPFKTAGGAPEVWAYGLRNPWRFSFDRSTSDLWIGDVGQDAIEEVDFTAKGSSAPRNYGWNTTEGNSCYNASTCSKTGIDLPVHACSRR